MRRWILAVLFASCAPAPSTCVPGQTVSCPCPGSGTGAQTCTERGTFAPCVCTGADADAGVDVAMDIASEPFPDVVCDRDLDGFRSRECGGDDCNDTDPTIAPGLPARCAAADYNCNGTADHEEGASQDALDRWCRENVRSPDYLAWSHPPRCVRPGAALPIPYRSTTVRCMACSQSMPGVYGCACWLDRTGESTCASGS